MPGEQLFAQKVPYSVEAEQAVIGSMLIDPNCIPKVIEAVVDSDFYIETNRLIFSTMSFMFTSGQIIDPITVMDEMKVMGYKNAANRDYFLQLIEMTPTSANVMEYCKIIRGKSLLRELQEISAEITQLTQDEQEDPQTIAELAEQKIYSVRQGREIKGLKTIKTAISEVYNHLDEMSKHPGKLPGLPTGFSDLDRMIGGLNNSDLILLASRPGMGKTSIALNIARAAIKDTNKAVVIFQLEMSSQQLAMRLLSGEALIDNKKLRMGNLDEDDWGRIAGAATSLTQNKILIDDNSGITVSEMKAKCRRLGNELGLVVVDYLQLMHSGRRIENRVQEVAEISRSLKIMAKDLNVPVLCLSQLSRGPESRQDKRPMLSDLRESGSIEQDADIVLFLYRPDYYPDAKPEAKNLAEVIIAKNRHGEEGKVELQCEGQFTTFRGRETRYDEPR